MSEHRIGVLVAEANQMGRQLMAAAFRDQERRMRVEVIATDSSAIVKVVQKKRPDVVVISARLEDGPTAGLKVLHELRAVKHAVPTVLLLDSEDRDLIVECFRSGARGVFCRSKPFEALCKCIQVISQGQIWADTLELQYVLEGLGESARLSIVNNREPVRLTKRQVEVIALVAEGLTNREIARHLGLSAHTVRNYLFRIFDKIGVSSRVNLVMYYNRRMAHADKPTDQRQDSSLVS
jgi:DNA-binding NarL/FixJ family response regulator